MTDLEKNSVDSLRDDFRAALGPSYPKPTELSTRKASKASPRITLRLKPEEDARLRRLSAGMTVSSYVRECVFGKDAKLPKTRRRHTPVADQKELARMLALLGETRIANNLNQLAHKANMGELSVDERMLQQIDEAYGHVQSMRTALIKALGLIEAS